MSFHTMILTSSDSTGVLKRTLCLNTGSPSMVQRLSILKKLPIHNGCVNCICWSQNGEYLLSGSDDHHLVVTNATKDFKTEVRYQTNHRANIFNARFLPNRSYTNVISCSGDGLITFSDLSYPIPPSYLPSDTNSFSCHTGTVYELTTIPQDPNTFLSAGEDYTVRCFDLRVKSKCHKIFCKDDILIQCQRAVTTISINEMAPYQMAIGTSDSTVRIFDRRMLGTISAVTHPSTSTCSTWAPLRLPLAPTIRWGMRGKERVGEEVQGVGMM
uniref:DDB1- and CUL4-associated factor 6 n=1 Tax=Cacopsylla melanoneura TaxID=428564 RepID=A0A8D8UKF9_9HEMI